ncbi:MAG: metallophosphoesterase [Anaerolineaceae bacterium]|nr:metallophosphoesterase [Anaerolineaceae bacterium]
MKIIKIEDDPFYELGYRSSGAQGGTQKCVLSFYQVRVQGLPKGIDSFIAASDLQGREDGEKNRLLGEVVAEELKILEELEEIPSIDLILLAGDFYDYPDCRKMGGTGDVTAVWNAFAGHFQHVVGVLGNHDMVAAERLKPNVTILDGTATTAFGLKIGGVSGIIGRPDRNQRKSEADYLQALKAVMSNHIVLLHQGPDYPDNGEIGEPGIRKFLERAGAGLTLFGHCFWKRPLATIGKNQVLNVDGRVFLFMRENNGV